MHPVSFLILFLPGLSWSRATGSTDADQDVLDTLNDPKADSAPSSIPPSARPAVGTTDAPVDGRNGKPKNGPFIEISRTGDSADKPKLKSPTESNKADPTSLKRLADEFSYEIPENNGGVMDDKDRLAPKEGTRGTEGGVSKKSKSLQDGASGKKVPVSPKEVPLPDDSLDSIGGDNDLSGSYGGGLEKPDDLPEKTHDTPLPVPPSASKDRKLQSSGGGAGDASLPSRGETDDGIIQPFHSFILSLTMILFSEVGDKTFLVAALMAMRHDRLLVFSAAFTALILMTVLSAVLGHAVPTLLPKKFTNFLAAVLFLIFGLKLLNEGYSMSPDEGVGEELKVVEMELEEKEHQARRQGERRSSTNPFILEAGRGRRSRSNQRPPPLPRSPSSSPSRSPSPGGSSISNMLVGLNNLLSLLLSPAWVQTFVMTFLGEWGDRSQIATIAMAAGQDYWWVTGGAIMGHGVCTAAAVVGGRAVAGRVSMRVVTLGGGISFIAFGIIYLVEAAYS